MKLFPFQYGMFVCVCIVEIERVKKTNVYLLILVLDWTIIYIETMSKQVNSATTNARRLLAHEMQVIMVESCTIENDYF